ncbi:hypothetical protein GCM10018966_005960 [Streptomyces yanii]
MQPGAGGSRRRSPDESELDRSGLGLSSRFIHVDIFWHTLILLAAAAVMAVAARRGSLSNAARWPRAAGGGLAIPCGVQA